MKSCNNIRLGKDTENLWFVILSQLRERLEDGILARGFSLGIDGL